MMCTENKRKNRQVEAYDDDGYNTRIIQVCVCCWEGRRGGGRCVEGGRGGGDGGGGGSATKIDTMSFKLEGRWVGLGKWVWHGFGAGWGLGAHRGPCRVSYLARMFLQRPSSFLKSDTSMRRAEFSFSRKEARMAIWFSFSRRASRDLLAATLFFLRRAQYLSS